mgnify:FL=1
MRKSTTFSFLLLVLFQLTGTLAQEDTERHEELFREVENYLYSPQQNRKESKSLYKEVKSVAETGNADAMYYLGMLQKDGIGTSQNLKKARNSFKRAHDLGNTKSAYAVGYFHLKGMGAVPQDYKKAYNWFKKSSEPIAKHWRAKMEFFGLGRKANKSKALKILRANKLYNSEVLLKQFEESISPTESSEGFKDFIAQSSVSEIHGLGSFHSFPDSKMLDGTWEGEYIELDWSKNKVFRVLPVSLEMSNAVNFKATLKISDSVSSASATYSAGLLQFSSLNIPIKKKFTDYPNFTHLMNEIKSIELRELFYNGQTVLVGRLKAFLPVWEEPANPILILLRKKPKISEAAIAAFEEQASDFLKVYPNPIEQHLLVNFELPYEAHVSLDIREYYGTNSYQNSVFSGIRAQGNNTIEILDIPQNSGSYLLTIKFDGITENKILIKK